MIILNSHEYESIRPVFSALRYSLSIDAVLDGTCPGSVFVNDRHQPTVALIVTHEGWYLEGERDEAFISALNRNLEEIITHQQSVGEYIYSWHYHPEHWKDILQQIMGNRTPMHNIRRYYEFKETKINWKERITDEVAVRQIDKDILKRTELVNYDEIAHWIHSNWGSEDNFFENGFGVVLIRGDTIVSWSLADCVSGDRCEIGIHTDEDHRKKGLGSTTAAINVEYAQTKGFDRIGWHCGETNIGSIKTAERVGFELVRKYSVLEGWFAPFDQYLELGFYFYRKGDYRKSAEYYEKCFMLGNQAYPEEKFWIGASGEKLLKNVFYYNCACAWALAGEKEKALDDLKLAIDWGWEHSRHMKNDSDLKSLHDEDQWEKILDRLQD